MELTAASIREEENQRGWVDGEQELPVAPWRLARAGADSTGVELGRARCCALEMEDEVGQASVGGNGGGAAGDGRGAGGVALLASARPKLEQEEREGNGIGAEDG